MRGNALPCKVPYDNDINNNDNNNNQRNWNAHYYQPEPIPCRTSASLKRLHSFLPRGTAFQLRCKLYAKFWSSRQLVNDLPWGLLTSIFVPHCVSIRPFLVLYCTNLSCPLQLRDFHYLYYVIYLCVFSSVTLVFLSFAVISIIVWHQNFLFRDSASVHALDLYALTGRMHSLKPLL